MSGSLRIERYVPAHKGQVVELERGLWRQKPANALRYFEWKYEQNPYAGEPTLYLAFDGSELVGIRGFYGSRWEAGQGATRETVSLLVADDFIVAPSYRNRGVVTRIMRSALEDLARRGHRYVLNLSGSEITVVSSLAMGWRSAGTLEPIGFWRETRARRLRARLSRARFFWRFAESAPMYSRDERAPFRHLDASRGSGAISVEREPRLDAMAGLSERLGDDGRIRHVRDREYLAWRYRNPICSYRFVYHGEAQLDGFLVLQVPAPCRAYLPRVVDLAAATGAVRNAMLDWVLDRARFSSVYAWAKTLPPDAVAHLAGRGWHPRGPQARPVGYPCVLVKALGAAADQQSWLLGGRSLADLADWDLRMLDTMAG